MQEPFLKDQEEFPSGLVNFNVEDFPIPVEELGYLSGTLGSGEPFKSTGKSPSGKYFNLPYQIFAPALCNGVGSFDSRAPHKSVWLRHMKLTETEGRLIRAIPLVVGWGVHSDVRGVEWFCSMISSMEEDVEIA